MKHKLALGLGIPALLVVAAAVAAPYWTGEIAEQKIRDAASQVEGLYGMPTTIESFERGYAQSTAVTVTTFPVDGEEPVRVTFDHVIDHGPKLGQAAVARIESTLRPGASMPPELLAALGDKSMLHVLTTVQADTSMTVKGTMPALTMNVVEDGAPTEIAFQGMTMDMAVGAGQSTMQGTATMPGATMKGGRANVDIGELSAEFDLVATDVPSLWLGDTSGKWTTFQVEPTDDSEPTVNLSGLGFHANAVESGGTYGVDVRYDIDALDVDDYSVRKVIFDLGFTDLDGEAMRQYMAVVKQVNAQMATIVTDPEAAEAIDQQLFAASMAMLTTGSPVMEIKALDADYAGGELRTRGKVQYAGSGDMAQFNPLADIVANLNLRVTEPMVMAIGADVLGMRTYGKPAATLTDEERETVNGAIRYQLAEVMRMGMVEKAEDGAYQVRAVLDNGGVLVNDAPTPFLPPPQPQ